MEQSLRIIAACADAMPDGPVRAETGGVPAGDGIGHVETARGETFHCIRSEGGRSPARHHVRAASYMNLQGLRPAVIGATVADAALIIMSVDPCQSCAARAALVAGEDQAP